MRILRLATAAIVLAYALASLVGAGAIAAFRLRAYSPPADIPPAVLDLMAAVSWPQLAVWAAAIALYLVVAIKLVRRVKAFIFWGSAFLLDVINWLWLRADGAFAAATPPWLVNADYVVLGANLAVGAVILVLGRTHLD